MPACKVEKNFHQKFKKWIETEFPSGIQEEFWSTLMEVDACHDYSTYPPADHFQSTHASNTDPLDPAEDGTSPILEDPNAPEYYDQMYLFSETQI